MKIFKLILLISLLALSLSGLFFLYNRLTGSFIEKSPPLIKAVSMPRGLGLLPAKISLEVSDRGAGLSGVSVKIKSRGKVKELMKQTFQGEPLAEIDLELSTQKLPELLNGQIELVVRAFDRSYFSNTSEEAFPLLVDLKKPTLEVLTAQHNVYQGNIELAVWQSRDENMHLTGVREGNQFFPGFPAKVVDTTFKGNLTYLGFFMPNPTENPDKSKIFITAEDLTGNSAITKFNYKIQARTFSPIKIKMNPDLLARIEALVSSARSRINAWKQSAGKDAAEQSLFDDFKLLEKLDRLDLQSIVAQAGGGKIWRGPFYPLIGTILNTYGSPTTYLQNNQPLMERLSLGYEVRTNPDQTIFAGNAGKVLYAGDLGIFGNSVILDHGLGITSLHGFLDKILVTKGDQIESGAALGTAGQTGFASSSGYYVEFMLQGLAFDPRGLWDQKWYEEHINKKLVSVKKALGLPIFSHSY